MIKQTIYLTVSNAFTRILGFIFFVLLARIFSVSDYGLFRYLITVSFIYIIFYTGYTVSLTRYISKNLNNQKEINKYYSNVLFISLLLFFTLSGIIFIFNKNGLLITLFLFSYFVDFFYTGLIRGFLDYKKLISFKFLENLIQVFIIGIFLITKLNLSINIAIFIFSISGLFSILILELLFKKTEIKFIFAHINIEIIKDLTINSLPLIFSAIGYEIMFNIDILFIKHFLGDTQLGYYSVTRTISQVYSFLPLAMATIIIPKAANNLSLQKIKNRMFINIFYVFVISIILFIFLLFFGKWIIVLLFTERYLVSYEILWIMSIGQIFLAGYLIISSMWQGAGILKLPALIMIFGAILNILLNYYLIPIYGLNGAAWSTTFSSIAIFLISLFYLSRYVKQDQ